MSTTWLSSSDLTNFFINKKILSAVIKPTSYNKNTDICCFSHIPKTAGTSLETVIAKNYKVSDTLHVNAPDLNEQPKVIRLKKHLPRFICGHHPLHGQLYQLIQKVPIFHFTQLRDPLDRVLSYYNYVKGKTDHPMHGYTKDGSIIHFLLKNPSPELCNGQSKRFSGYLHSGLATDDQLFTESRDALITCFSLVLTTCLFDESLLLLKKRLGLSDVFYQRENVSQKFIDKQSLDDATLNFILENNQADMQLFEWAKNQCQILIANELTAETIQRFRSDNQTWQQLINSQSE
ncbi:MAG: sulfotransferase family 2 domain-containing protein [Xanthomonadales bacterium]|nr:sulfotransferase family 2 domain-containing protein [Xanthomonadales bacterium]